jgi:hypothetical protein
MADAEARAKAEKLAAAKKRVSTNSTNIMNQKWSFDSYANTIWVVG